MLFTNSSFSSIVIGAVISVFLIKIDIVIFVFLIISVVIVVVVTDFFTVIISIGYRNVVDKFS